MTSATEVNWGQVAGMLRELPSTLRVERARRSVKQSDVASFLGVSQQTLSRYESGRWPPRHAVLLRILEWLDN